MDAAAPGPDFCRLFLDSLPITGVSVTVIASSGAPLTLCVSDDIAARIDELHFELGEGPQWAAARTGELVMISDTATGPHDHWPVFASALAQLPVRALFCVPMRMGAATVGVATLYCDMPRSLTADQQVSALAIASAIAGAAVHQAVSTAAAEPEGSVTPAFRREVHQATGIMLVQLDTTATVAYARLQAYAFANGRSVHAVALDVVSGLLTFEESAP